MSPQDSSGESIESAEPEVEESWREDHLGVRVKRLRWNQPGYEDRVRLKISAPRRDTYGSLEGDGTREVERHVEIASLPPQNATEVLFGLAEAHGYKLVEK
jgi:hypothetical protein